MKNVHKTKLEKKNKALKNSTPPGILLREPSHARRENP